MRWASLPTTSQRTGPPAASVARERRGVTGTVAEGRAGCGESLGMGSGAWVRLTLYPIELTLKLVWRVTLTSSQARRRGATRGLRGTPRIARAFA